MYRDGLGQCSEPQGTLNPQNFYDHTVTKMAAPLEGDLVFPRDEVLELSLNGLKELIGTTLSYQALADILPHQETLRGFFNAYVERLGLNSVEGLGDIIPRPLDSTSLRYLTGLLEQKGKD